MDSLVIVTDLAHADRDEDLFLADALSAGWRCTLATPEDAALLAWGGGATSALIRNAWPSRDHVAAFDALEAAVRDGSLRAYNPPSRTRGYREDKSYLTGLHSDGYAVVPTWATKEAMTAASTRYTETAVFKPLDGCSGHGVTFGPLTNLPSHGGVYQLAMQFVHEVSIFYLDGSFAYALRTGEAGSDRWDLSPFEPDKRDLEWASAFVAWNGLPYGVQRIDGGRTSDGDLWLLEVEDFMPFLSLDALDPKARDKFVFDLGASLSRHVRPSRA